MLLQCMFAASIIPVLLEEGKQNLIRISFSALVGFYDSSFGADVAITVEVFYPKLTFFRPGFGEEIYGDEGLVWFEAMLFSGGDD